MRYNKRFLRRVMTERDLTGDALARKSGITRQTIHAIARGAEPKASTLGKLAAALSVDVDDFFIRRIA